MDTSDIGPMASRMMRRYGKTILLMIVTLVVLQVVYNALLPSQKTLPESHQLAKNGLHQSRKLAYNKNDNLQLVQEQETLEAGKFIQSQRLKGALFNQDGVREQIITKTDTSLIHSFSPNTEKDVAAMFADGDKENIYSAIAPAITWYKGDILAVLRIWLSQFEYADVYKKGKDSIKNTWQENHLYTITLDKHFKPLTKGTLIGIPTPSNAGFTYRSDGPMDPRLFVLNGKPYISFHMWKHDDDDDDSRARVHIWDYEESQIRKLRVKNFTLSTGEINWSPLVVNNTLYYIYLLDPFKVLRCDVKTGFCDSVTQNDGKFNYQNSHIRGGSPFVEYQYPYYVGLAHSTLVTSSPKDNFGIYNAHLVVISVEPFRIVYVSDMLLFNKDFLSSLPIGRPYAQMKPFVFPVGIVIRNDDVIDFGAHLSDSGGFILRMRGIKKLMSSVMSLDKHFQTEIGPKNSDVNWYVHNCVREHHRDVRFYGDDLYNIESSLDIETRRRSNIKPKDLFAIDFTKDEENDAFFNNPKKV